MIRYCPALWRKLFEGRLRDIKRHTISPALMALGTRRLLDHLDVRAADLLGFSMGARVGLQAVLDFPDRWRHAVLAGLGMRGAIDQSASIARALRGGKPENPVAQSFYSFASARPHNDLEALAACIEAPQTRQDSLFSGVGLRRPSLIIA